MVKLRINGQDLVLNKWLQQKLDNVKYMMDKEWDVVFLIDGIEGGGKSTLSFICGWYISDGKITIDNVCEGTENAVRQLEKLPDKSVLIIDEGSLMFSSKEVMRKEQRQLIKILNVIRQKRMCLIIVAPSFFDLNKYISVNRSRFLLHVYTDKKLNRGRFAFFGERKKKLLYGLGKKNYNSYSKPKSDFVSTFSEFDPFGEAYQEKKRRSLMEAFHDTIKAHEIPEDIKKQIIKENLLLLVKVLPITTRELLAKTVGYDPRTLYSWEHPKKLG